MLIQVISSLTEYWWRSGSAPGTFVLGATASQQGPKKVKKSLT